MQTALIVLCLTAFTTALLEAETVATASGRRREENAAEVYRKVDVGRINTISDIILCTVGILEFMIRIKLVPPCWGKHCESRRTEAGNSTLTRRQDSDERTVIATLGDMSCTFKSTFEALEALTTPRIESVTNYEGLDMDRAWRSSLVRLENMNISLDPHQNADGSDVNLASVNVTSDYQVVAETVDISRDITPLLQTMVIILDGSDGVCQYMRSLRSGEPTIPMISGEDPIYATAERLHHGLRIVQNQTRRTILLDGVIIDSRVLINAAGALLDKFCTCG